MSNFYTFSEEKKEKKRRNMEVKKGKQEGNYIYIYIIEKKEN